jgi:hypothetical protein
MDDARSNTNQIYMLPARGRCHPVSHTVSLHNMYRFGHTAVGTVSVYCAVRAEHFDIIQTDFTRRFNTISARSPRKHNTGAVQLQTDRQLPPHMPARQTIYDVVFTVVVSISAY